MGRLLRLIWFFCLFVLLFTSKVFAIEYFIDDFNSRDESVWSYFCNYFNSSRCSSSSPNIVYVDSNITLNSHTADFPVVLSSNVLFPDVGDFAVKIKFRYPTVTSRGVGLGVGFTGPAPYNKLFSQFGIWNDTTMDGFRFYYNDFGDNTTQGFCSNFTNSTSDTFGRRTVTNIELSNSFWHLFEIYKIGSTYSIYIDRNLNTSPVFSTDIKNNCVPKFIWFGNFMEDGGGDWTSLSLDKIELSNETGLFPIPTEMPEPTLMPTQMPTMVPTLTPTSIPTLIPTQIPTPTPIERKKKIFILPGLGASWNSRAIVYGQSVSNSDWKMTPLVNSYDGLIELMEKNNLERDKDYFVWNYDWRKSVADIKNDFNTYLAGKNLSDSDEIYLVGHSLGGVVARLWAQDNSDNGNIKKIITLGSPNLGSLDAYSVWNGGKVLKNNGLSSVIFNIILGLQNKGFILTDLNKIRTYAPVVKNLLPVFNYATKSKKMLGWREMESYNDFLKNQNDNLYRVIDKFIPITGVGFSTPSIVSLTNRSFISKSLGLWPDGEISDYFVSVGDETVLKKSSTMNLSDVLEINSKHSELPTKSIETVASEIGLESKDISFSYVDNYSDGFVVFVGSPVNSFLKCGSDIYQENDGFIVVKNKVYNDCDLYLLPVDNGTVHIVLGNITDNKWNYFENDVTLGNPKKIKIDYKKAEVQIDASNRQVLRDQIKSDLVKLRLDKAIKFLDKNDLGKVAWYVFEYREKNDEQIISQKILDNLFVLGSIISPDKIKGNYKWLDLYTDLIKNTLELKSKRKNISWGSSIALMRLENMEDKVSEMMKNKKYPDYSLVVVLAVGYGNEAVKM
ncbi:MAG: hypothetical protein KIH89_003805 [Candidatus Shapirobacteria bacterium]|nr:hypothetical protein [Candidatus Shapirobacteria bacterium]